MSIFFCTNDVTGSVSWRLLYHPIHNLNIWRQQSCQPCHPLTLCAAPVQANQYFSFLTYWLYISTVWKGTWVPPYISPIPAEAMNKMTQAGVMVEVLL